jgi:hypothetical protein
VTVTLFRPVGQAELDLIEHSAWTAFPPRLEFQPIFYPVCNRQYADEIAERWNTKDPASGFVGYVTEFDIDATYLEGFSVQTVGAGYHQEYWIPSEELANFNRHIVGPIRVVGEFR